MEKIKGFWRRNKQRVMQRMGWADKTVDEDYTAVQQRYAQVVENLKIIAKSVQRMQHAFTENVIHFNQLATATDTVLEEGDRYEPAATRFLQSMQSLDKAVLEPVHDILPKECMNPIAEYVALAAEVEKLLDLRKTKLLEFDFRRNKYDTTKDSKTEDKARRKIKMEIARKEYEVANRNAVDAMCSFIERRNEFLEPYFEGVLKSIRMFCQRTAEHIEPVIPLIQNAPAQSSSSTSTLDSIRARVVANGGASSSSSGSPSSSASPASSSSQATVASTRVAAPAAPAAATRAASDDVDRIKRELGDEFFYLDSSNAQQGAVTLSALRDLYRSRAVEDSTMVFGHGMKNWEEIRSQDKLRTFLSS